MGAKSSGPAWLPLGQAAKRLGVHPTTLRRWAENGDFPVMVTPGGHRRFAETDLARFALERSRPTGQGTMPEGWQDWTLGRLGEGWTDRGIEYGFGIDSASTGQVRESLLDLLALVPNPPEPADNFELVRSKAVRLSQSFVPKLVDRGGSLTQLTEIVQLARAEAPTVVLSHPELIGVPQEVEDALRQYLVAIVDGIQLAICQSWEDKNPTSFGGRPEARRYGRPARQHL